MSKIHNKESEQYVLGAMLLDSSTAMVEVGALEYNDFYIPEHKIIFKAIKQLINNQEEFAIMKVFDYVKHFDEEGIVNLDYINFLINNVPYYVNACGAHARIIVDKKVERDLEDTLRKFADDIGKTGATSVLLEESLNRIREIMNRKTSAQSLVHVNKTATKLIRRLETHTEKTGLTGLNTGYDDLNKLTDGLQPGQLWILAARTGEGKTTFALNIIRRVCEENKDKNVVLISLETSGEFLVNKMFSEMSLIPFKKIQDLTLSPVEKGTIKKIYPKISNFRLSINDETNSNIENLVLMCRQLKDNNMLDLLVIDYLQLMSTTKKDPNRVNEIGTVSRYLKKICLDLKIPIIALAQLSRESVRRSLKGSTNKKDGNSESKDHFSLAPKLIDLRESGNIEQDADVVIALYEDNTKDMNEKPNETIKYCTVLKNRFGSTFTFKLKFNGSISKFSEIEND